MDNQPLDVSDLVGKASQQSLQPTQPQQAPQQQEQWYQKILPTAGSIIGGIAGVPLAAVTGGIINPLTGAALGAGLGKAAENLTTNQDLMKGVGEEALTSAVTGGILGGIGKGVGFAAKTLKPQFAKGAGSMFAGQAPKGAISSETAKEMAVKYGLNSPEEAAQLSRILSGSSTAPQGQSILTKNLEDAIVNYHSAQPDKLTKFADFYTAYGNRNKDVISRLINDPKSFIGQRLNANSLSEVSQAEPIRRQVASIFNKYTTDASVSGRIEPLQALRAQREFANLARYNEQLAARGGNPQAANTANFYKDLSNELKSRLKISADDPINAIPISQNEKNAIAEQIRNSKVKGADRVANEIETNPDINNWAQIRQLESPFVETSQASQAAFRASEKKFGTTGQDVAATMAGFGLGGPGGAAGLYLGSKALESPLFAKQATGVLGKLANVKPEVSKTLGRIGAVTGGTLGTVPGWANQETNMPIGGATDMQDQSEAATAGSLPIAELYRTLLEQERAGGGRNAAIVSALSGLAPQAQLTNEFQRVTGGLGAAYLGAGGPQGLLGGLGALSTQFIPGTPANLYARQQQLAGSMYQNLYGVPTGTAVSAMPQFTQSPYSAGIAGSNFGF